MKPKTIPSLLNVKESYDVYGVNGGPAGVIKYSEKGGHYYVFAPNMQFVLVEETVKFIADALEKLNKTLQRKNQK